MIIKAGAVESGYNIYTIQTALLNSFSSGPFKLPHDSVYIQMRPIKENK